MEQFRFTTDNTEVAKTIFYIICNAPKYFIASLSHIPAQKFYYLDVTLNLRSNLTLYLLKQAIFDLKK